MMLKCLILGGAFTMLVSAQTNMKIIVPPEIEAQGITLLPSSDAEAMRHIGRIAGIDLESIRSILPYSVVLVNNGQSQLLQTTVGFSFEDVDGQPHRPIFNITDFNRGFPTQVTRGGARLFLPQRGLNVYFTSKAVHATPETIGTFSGLISRIAADFKNVKDLTAFIDSVTIEYVGLVGPDTIGLRDKGQDRKTMY